MNTSAGPAEPRLYNDLAWLWPLLSPPEDYRPEAALVLRLLHAYLPSPRKSQPWRLLELGAGGGHTLVHLRRWARCTAVDLSPSMLELCRRLVPDADIVVGDMRTVRLGATFDAVLIHDAIDHLTTRADLLAALRTARAHLRPGGLAIVGPTYFQQQLRTPEFGIDGRHLGDTELLYVQRVDRADSRKRPHLLDFDLTIAVRRHGMLEIISDTDQTAAFPAATWRALIRRAGLRPTRPRVALRDTPWHPLLARC